jgi:hypothetical protein
MLCDASQFQTAYLRVEPVSNGTLFRR